MYSIGILGLGVVGLVNLCCFAEMGFSVIGFDVTEKIKKIKNDNLYVYEPRLRELLNKNKFKINFTDSADSIIQSCNILIICVGTPSGKDGRTDLSQVEEIADLIGSHINSYKLIIQKSTVPAGTTNRIIKSRIEQKNHDCSYDLVMSPEFLREGQGINDFFNPDRIIWGTENINTYKTAKILYAEHTDKIVCCSIEAAEVIKQASNFFLAMKISYINLMSDLCEAVNADINDVAKGICLDKRIGDQFMQSGIGFGGSCLLKDSQSIKWLLKDENINTSLVDSVLDINEKRIDKLIEILLSKQLINKFSNVTVFGITFKEDTNDCRESQVLRLVLKLSEMTKHVRCYDYNMSSIDTEKYKRNNITFSTDAYQSAENSDLLILGHGGASLKGFDLMKIAKMMKRLQIFDCMNKGNFQRPQGFSYYSFGGIFR